MDLLFLGTGAGVPSKTRNVASICLRMPQECRQVWMFDCGEGTQHQILRFPVKLRQLEKLFITHLHGDHVFGIPGLLGTRSSQGAETPLSLYGPPGLKRFVETSLEVSESHLTYDLTLQEIEQPGVVMDDGQFTVEADFLNHNILSIGYRITEHPRPGKLKAEKLRTLGVPTGPLYGRLKAGQPITLENGRTIRPEEVLTPPIPGRVVTILGDTRPARQIVRLAAEADLLVHEATFGEDSSSLAPDYGHSTAINAAQAAKEAKAGQLVLTHISQRYTEESAQELLVQAKTVFPRTLLASDGTVVEIPADGF